MPKPAETKSQPPATFNAALEDAYYATPQTDFHQYRTKVTGYSPSPNRYYVRLTAPVGSVPTTNWNDQKANVTGYTQPSNQYFATRARLAYHPPDKTFGTFSGVSMSFEGGTTTQASESKQTQQAPPPQQTSYSDNNSKSRQEQLKDYEGNYLKRIEQDRIEAEQAYQKALQAEAAAAAAADSAKKSRGVLPKGFNPEPEPEPPKASRGTLPKGF